jgi:putative nucleotidyltransferase with HDIG domain
VIQPVTSKTSTRDRQSGIEKGKESVRRLFIESSRLRWYLLLAITAIFLFILYPHLVVNRPSYELGDVAEKNIKAPKDFLIEDKAATETNRERAVAGVLTVYDYDKALMPGIDKRIETLFAEWRDIIEKTRRQQETIAAENEVPEDITPQPQEMATGWQDKIRQEKQNFTQRIGIDISDGAYNILMKEEFSTEIADSIIQILSAIFNNGVVTNKAILLKEADKGIVLRDVETKAERTVTDLVQFFDLDQAKSMVRKISKPLLKDHGYILRNLIVDLTERLIQPNITLNKSETEERKKKAAEEISPILYKIKAGEMLLREGERVTQIQLLKLKALEDRLEQEKLLPGVIGAALIIICLLVMAYNLFLPRLGQSMGEKNKTLVFITIVLITFILVTEISTFLAETLTMRETASLSPGSIVYGIPLGAGAMIICLALGFELALPFACVLAICATISFNFKFTLFLYFLASSAMAAYWIRDCRERKVFIKAGAKLGLLNIFLITAIDIYSGQFFGTTMLWDWAFAFAGGISAGIVAAGIVPLVEIAFGYTTDITLLELANLDRPLLKQLLMEAPGTYHHSVIVGSMVEAAAADIGVNPLLAKVCGYYHDIGKINKPLYFIENQVGGKNKHDKLAPSMSSLILMAHVKDGVEFARKNKLGTAIIDTIQQHHGTSLITYFYDKAVQKKGEGAVKIDDFRYAGPKPQSREIGLVMLADVVEAASRTLANPTPSRIQGLVQNLINRVFSDGQLDDCELTLKDLHNIARSFYKILNAVHHHRIDYPESRAASNGKGKNESSDRQQAKKVQNISKDANGKSQSRLKRLGLS